jgi:xylulokinase
MSTDALFIAVDVGTTGARATAVDLDGRILHEARRDYPTSTPRAGWAEQNPRDWRERALEALAALAAEPLVASDRVRAIGLTGQCPTIAPFDGAREPIGAGLLYRDNRATEQADEMRRLIGDQAMHERTGHVASAFHVGPKVLWIRRHQPDVYARTDRFMQPRDVVLHALTGITATDETHANSTLFFDLRARRWADDLLDSFALNADLFPAVAPPWQQIGILRGDVADRIGLPAECPVIIGAADSQCTAFGSHVQAPGLVSEMAGASSCLNSVIPEPSPDLRITHYSHVVPGLYCTELGVNVSGAALSWAVDRLRLTGFDELEAGAQRTLSALSNGRIGDPRLTAPLFLPYLGDGDRDDPTLRAAFIGLSDRHSSDELSYSIVEGLAFAITEAVSVLAGSRGPLEELRIAGGGARMNVLGQIKADALESPVRHLEHDSAPIGAALLAACNTGYAEQAGAALAANVARAHCFEPTTASGSAIRDRYQWFLEARESETVRLRP